MLIFARLTASNCSHNAAVHVRGVINNRVIEEQIREDLIQVSFEVGRPAGLEATRVADKVFE